MEREIRKPDASRPRRRWHALAILAAGCVFFGFGWAKSFHRDPVGVESIDPIFAETSETDFSKFLHSNPTHARMPCMLCHRRDTNASRITFPGAGGHTPCIGCHAQQFTSNTNPICTICHTDVGMKTFPDLREFNMRFDHGKHARTNCSVCHKAARRGVALSIPSGPTAHTTCFQCHTATSANTMASCSVCHQLGRYTRTSENAKAFRISFSHARHDRAGLNCANCHTIRAGASRGGQVTEPKPAMHFASPGAASCAACHNGTKAFGPNDFANCKRCHLGNKFSF